MTPKPFNPLVKRLKKTPPPGKDNRFDQIHRPKNVVKIPDHSFADMDDQQIDEIINSWDEGQCLSAYLTLIQRLEKLNPDEKIDELAQLIVVRVNEISIRRFFVEGETCEHIGFEVVYDQPGDEYYVRRCLERGIIFLSDKGPYKNPNKVNIHVR